MFIGTLLIDLFVKEYDRHRKKEVIHFWRKETKKSLKWFETHLYDTMLRFLDSISKTGMGSVLQLDDQVSRFMYLQYSRLFE